MNTIKLKDIDNKYTIEQLRDLYIKDKIMQYVLENYKLINYIVRSQTIGRPSSLHHLDIAQSVYIQICESLIRHLDYIVWTAAQDETEEPEIQTINNLSTMITNATIDQIRAYINHSSKLMPITEVEYNDVVKMSMKKEEEISEELNNRELIEDIKESITEDSYKLLKLSAEGVSYQELAIEFNIPVGTVKSRLSTIRKFIKSRLDNKYNENKNIKEENKEKDKE